MDRFGVTMSSAKRYRSYNLNPQFGGRKWVKLWVNEWLDGTTRFEMTDAQRAFWTDLIAMAGRSRFPGTICAGEVEGKFVGYPLNKFQSLMSEPLDIEETFAIFVKTGKVTIEITSEAPVRLFKVNLLNWGRYQSEYQRQKPYRVNKIKKRLQDGDAKSDTKGNTTEVEVEGEGEEKHSVLPVSTLIPGASKSTPKKSLSKSKVEPKKVDRFGVLLAKQD
jgi:hypothetical protein